MFPHLPRTLSELHSFISTDPSSQSPRSPHVVLLDGTVVQLSQFKLPFLNGLPRASKQRHLLAFLRGEPRGKIGKRNYLEEDESRVLERELIELISNGLTPTFKDVAAMARAIKDRRTVFIETSHIDPSRTWVSRWVLAHPKFRAFKPILMELRRQNCLTKSHVAPFFANLQKLVDENHYSPSLMFNFDETSLISTQYVYEKKVGFSSDLVAYTVPPSLTKQSTELIPWLKVVQSAALNALVNAQAVQESFRTTGIYPMNPATVTNKLREGNDTEERRRGFPLGSNILSEESFQQAWRRYLRMPTNETAEEVEPAASISISSEIDESDRELDIFQINLRKRLQFPFGQVDQIDSSDHDQPITDLDSQLELPQEPVSPLSPSHVFVKRELIHDDIEDDLAIDTIQPQKRKTSTKPPHRIRTAPKWMLDYK
ncbi:hypothetical protein BLNAU_10278 [Blattamonas nauphoetae]|uniref:HTH CENPB-type domain-containing protein n=1 Tax=Blattamonas nauphoetae TaxID=2049346 RepID=A0ABQ9XTI4_9EUKA|nr:hypothetical protein BLNAU_10278 [Blattamonas nauphoetae]